MVLRTLRNQILDITSLKSFTFDFCSKLSVGDIILLEGELGTGKTTLARHIINNLYLVNNLPKPSTISSPTFPILLTYELDSYEIYHYDLYRIKNTKELSELNIFENTSSSITLIEWPEVLIKNSSIKNFYLIKLDLHSETERKIEIIYSN